MLLTEFLGHFLPGNCLPKRLFSNPPVFRVGNPSGYHPEVTSLGFTIGGFKVDSDFSPGGAEAVAVALITSVPPSVTTLNLEFSRLDAQEWKQNFRSPRIALVECAELEPVSESFWDALTSPEGGDRVVLCTRLKYIVLEVHAKTAQLKPPISCLRRRRSAGFKLRHSKIREDNPWAYKVAEHIRPLVKMLEVDFPSELTQKMSPTSMGGSGMR